MRAGGWKKDDLYQRIVDNDRMLVGAPSLDTDYGFGRATERCLRDGICWRCMKADAVDEMVEVGLCQRCLDFLRWEPPEPEPVRVHTCSEWCRCRDRLAAVCFAALRASIEEGSVVYEGTKHEIGRIVRMVGFVVGVVAVIVVAVLIYEALQ